MNYCPCCGTASKSSSSQAEAPRRRQTARTSASPRPAASTGAMLGADESRCKVLTVGHSTRPIEVFIELLAGHGVTQLIDVRTVPRSRHNPQFSEDVLPFSLVVANIAYAHASGLGGFRPTTADSANIGWRNLSFQGYADYMQTTDFAANAGERHRVGADRPRRPDVRRSCAVALPSLADRRRVASAWRRRMRDRQPEAPAATQADAVCPRSGRGKRWPRLSKQRN